VNHAVQVQARRPTHSATSALARNVCLSLSRSRFSIGPTVIVSENSSRIARVMDATPCKAEVAAETDSVTATPTSYDDVLASSVPTMVMTVSLAYSSGG